jgi:hypothetical protein
LRSIEKEEYAKAMATELPTTNGHDAQDGETNFAVKAGLARILKGGVIMDVVNAEQVCSYSYSFSSKSAAFAPHFVRHSMRESMLIPW